MNEEHIGEPGSLHHVLSSYGYERLGDPGKGWYQYSKGRHSVLATNSNKGLEWSHNNYAKKNSKATKGTGTESLHKHLSSLHEEHNMNEDLSPIADAITLVANGQAGEATGLVHDLLGARVLDALQSHKQEIAQSLFAPSADALAEESEQLDEISLKTKFSAYKAAAEAEDSGQPKERERSKSLTARIEKDVEKKHGAKMVGNLERAASVQHYGRAALKK